MGKEQYYALVFSVTCCLCLYFFAWRPYQLVLHQNPCEMTYSRSPAQRRVEVPMNKTASKYATSFKLWKFSTTNEKEWKDKETIGSAGALPVLFIPGHQGSADQARSLASDVMHNQAGPFQYFAVDFGDRWSSSSAVHGDNVVAQAVFVNEALAHIQRMYAGRIAREAGIKKGKNKGKAKAEGDDTSTAESTPLPPPPKVVLVAHSAGGAVARLAVLLSNHPRRLVEQPTSSSSSANSNNNSTDLDDGGQSCLVSTLLMLSSPVSRPAYALDASLDVLYAAINRAWLASFFHDSKQCAVSGIRGAAIAKRREVEGAIAGAGAGEVHADWLCPRCVRSISVVSVTGGVLDAMVHPSLTHLGVVTPQPTKASVSLAASSPATSARRKGQGAVQLGSFWDIVGRNPGDIMLSVLVRPHTVAYHLAMLGAANLWTGAVWSFQAAIKGGHQLVQLASSSVNDASTGNQSGNSTDGGLAAEILSSSTDGLAAVSGTVADEFEPMVKAEISEEALAAAAAKTAEEEAAAEAAEERAAWLSRMMAYSEPRYLSIFTNQLTSPPRGVGVDVVTSVGFSVDHAATLWCFQLLERLHSGLAALALDSHKSPSQPLEQQPEFITTTSGNEVVYSEAAKGYPHLYDKFALQPPVMSASNTAIAVQEQPHCTSAEDNNSSCAALPPMRPRSIPAQVVHFAIRNASAALQWAGEGADADLHYVASSLSEGAAGSSLYAFLGTLGVVYLTRHAVSCILACYLLVGVLVLTVPIVRRLGGVTGKTIATQTSMAQLVHLLRPSVHWHLDILVPATVAAASAGLDPTKSKKLNVMAIFTAVCGVLCARMLFLLYFAVSEASSSCTTQVCSSTAVTIALVRFFQHTFKWVVSYGAAIMLHYLVSFHLYLVRLAFSMFVCAPLSTLLIVWPWAAMRWLLRKTLWRIKPIRKFLKKSLGVRLSDGQTAEEEEDEGVETDGPADESAADAEKRKRRARAAAAAAAASSAAAGVNAKSSLSVMQRICRLVYACLAVALLAALVGVSGSGNGPESAQQRLGSGYYGLTVACLWLYLMLMFNFVLLWLLSNGISGGVAGGVTTLPLRLGSYEVSTLALYVVVLVLLLPNALNSAEVLLPMHSTGSAAPSLLTTVLDALRTTAVGDNAVLKNMGSYEPYSANAATSGITAAAAAASMAAAGASKIRNMWGSQRVYDLLCLAAFNVHLLCVMMAPPGAGRTGAKGKTAAGSPATAVQVHPLAAISNTVPSKGAPQPASCALDWCVRVFGLSHADFDPTVAAAGAGGGGGTVDSAGIYAAAMKSNSDAGAAKGKGAACCHEDGGKYAIFEEVVENLQEKKTSVNGTGTPVTVGLKKSKSATTFFPAKRFRVVFCACSKDKSLSNGVADYCEWCRCIRCGGKNLPRDPNAAEYWTSPDGYTGVGGMPTDAAGLQALLSHSVNLELILVVCLLVSCLWTYRIYSTGADGLYQYTYSVCSWCVAVVAYSYAKSASQ